MHRTISPLWRSSNCTRAFSVCTSFPPPRNEHRFHLKASNSINVESTRTKEYIYKEYYLEEHLVPTFTQWTSFPPQRMSIPCVESIKSTYYLEEQVNVDDSSSRACLNSTKWSPFCLLQSIHLGSPSRNLNCQRPPFAKLTYTVIDCCPFLFVS